MHEIPVLNRMYRAVENRGDQRQQPCPRELAI